MSILVASICKDNKLLSSIALLTLQNYIISRNCHLFCVTNTLQNVSIVVLVCIPQTNSSIFIY